MRPLPSFPRTRESMFRKRWIPAFAGTTVMLLMSFAAHALSLERFQSYVRTTQAARGDFEHKVYDRTGRMVQESKGSLAILRPGRYRWT